MTPAVSISCGGHALGDQEVGDGAGALLGERLVARRAAGAVGEADEADLAELHVGEHHRGGGGVHLAAGGEAGAAGVEADAGQRLLGRRRRRRRDGLGGRGRLAGLDRGELDVEGEALAQVGELEAEGGELGRGAPSSSASRAASASVISARPASRAARVSPSTASVASRSASVVSSVAMRLSSSATAGSGRPARRRRFGLGAAAATTRGGAGAGGAVSPRESPRSPVCTERTPATASAEAPAIKP